MNKKEVFYDDDYVVYRLALDQKLFEVIWKNTAFLNENTFKKIILKQREGVSQYQPQKMLIDTTHFEYSIDPELQKWFDEYIFQTLYQAGVQKVGIVISKHLFARISIEQTMEEGSGILFNTRYFHNYEDAQTWLLD